MSSQTGWEREFAAFCDGLQPRLLRSIALYVGPDGRVFFFDDNHRTDVELVEGIHSPIVQRKLNDGTPFRVIKIPYEPADLERRLRSLNWDISVTGTSGPFYWGTGGR